ncbi:MAG: dienelactone hydrolase family protein [Myxococcales bacterium]|nr:dienelactone hydrolase family protein [Myxococcales bacterium]
MAEIVLFHSAYGLRPAVQDAAERLRQTGHHVTVPDLYRGATAATLEEALAIRDRIGREVLLDRARAAAAAAPNDSVLAGFSLGAALAQRVANTDPRFVRLLLFHDFAELGAQSPKWWVQAHFAVGDPFTPKDEIDPWRASLEARGSEVEVAFHRGGHLFTDPGLPDHDAASAATAWEMAERFLRA